MNGQMIVIKPDGSQTVADCTRRVPLEMLQAAVGGYIEAVPGFEQIDGKPCVVYCNEDGKLEGLQPNPVATGLWANAIGLKVDELGDELCGPIVILTGDKKFLA